MSSFFTNKEFTAIDYSKTPLLKGEYDTCTFINCIFTEVDLSMITFLECEFIECNLSMAKLNGVSLNDVSFKTCKLLGLNFNNCNDYLFDAHFEDCNLNLASFYKLKLKGNHFKNCSLHEVDFIEADLTGAHFDTCDLSRAVFENTNLEGTDFRNAYNFSIDPELNKMMKAKFSIEGIKGLLEKYNIEVL